MTIQRRRFYSAKRAIGFLGDLAEKQDDYVFRGHASEAFRLRTTLERYWSIQHEDWDPTPQLLVESFKAGLVKNGLKAIADGSKLDWLEYARHHGVPAPLLDLSWSPFVALFFAFDGVREPPQTEKAGYSVVYALNVTTLAAFWAWRRSRVSPEPAEEYIRLRRAFLHAEETLIDGYPGNTLGFLPQPGLHTERMHRQAGAFLYCTLYYADAAAEDLEDYLDKIDEEEPHFGKAGRDPVLTKVEISHRCAGDVFSRLEVMGLLGGYLLASPDGVAADVKNAYNYRSRTHYLREDSRNGS